KRIAFVRPSAPPHRARIPSTVFEHRGLHLHPHKSSSIFHDKVIVRRLSPWLGHLQPVFCRPSHKLQLGPFAPPLRMLNLHAASFCPAVLHTGVFRPTVSHARPFFDCFLAMQLCHPERKFGFACESKQSRGTLCLPVVMLLVTPKSGFSR